MFVRKGAVREQGDGEAGGESPGGLLGLRKQMRTKRRLRVLTLVSISVVVLGLLPLIFGIRSTTRDPVFNSLDALSVPGWADNQVQDQSSGSRWCFLECRFRERTAQSERPFDETAQAYSAALASAGWKARGGQCTDQPATVRQVHLLDQGRVHSGPVGAAA